MSGRHLAMLFLLAAIWGSSFMFIKVAVRDIAPSTALLGRLGLATLALVAVSLLRTPLRGTARAFRTYAVPLVVVGVVNTAPPLLGRDAHRLGHGSRHRGDRAAGTAIFAFFFCVHARAAR